MASVSTASTQAATTTTPATVSGTASATAATAAGGTALQKLSGNFNDFLKLLMTQLQNQDPTSPMDANQFTSQLVQFSSVEQQIGANTNLTKLIQLTQGNAVLQGSALVGKQVEVEGDHLSLQQGTAGIRFTTAAAQPVQITVSNASGVAVRQVNLTSQAGANGWTWDGKDANGKAMADGAYGVMVTGASGTGTSGTGASGAVPFNVLATATGVQRKDDALKLQLGGLTVDMTAVQSVRQ